MRDNFAPKPGDGRDSGDVAPIRAILFDKDGTLVDFDRTWGPAVQAVLRHFAGGNAALYRKLCAASGLVDGARFLPESPLITEPTNIFAARWASLLGRPADAAFTKETDRLLCEATTAHLAAIGNPRAVLGELAGRGYRLGLTTNDAEATARVHVQRLGLDRMLAFVAGYDSGFGCKPAPGPVHAFAAAVGVSAREIVMVGDTALDIAMARTAGAKAVLVLTGPKSSDDAPEAKADAVIASIAQLSAWLE
jgi:phosphoglycolate phosphatase